MVAALCLAAAPARSQSVQLMCRGPLEILNGQQSRFGAPTGFGPVVVFRPGSVAAGSNGDGVEPGTCAFPDRGFRSGEPRVLLLGLYQGVGHDQGDVDPSHSSVIGTVTLQVREMLEQDRQVAFLSRDDYVTVLMVNLRSIPARFWETGRGRTERLIPAGRPGVPLRDPRDRPPTP